MDQHEFYYLDRPTVPATQQVVINRQAIVSNSIPVNTSQMGFWWADVTEMKNSEGDVVGVLAYFDAISYATLIAPEESDIENAVKDSAAHQDETHEDSESPISSAFGQVAYHYDGKDFAADKEVAELLEQVESSQTGDYEGDEGELIDKLADALVKLQIRNNNQRDMLLKRASDDDM